MNTQIDIVKKFEDEISGIIATEREAGRLCYLAKIGAQLGKEKLDQIKASTGLSLSRFITTYMGDRYVEIAIGGLKSALAVVPIGEDKNLPASLSASKRETHPRYARNLWLAFSIPSFGESRYFNPTRRIFSINRPGDDELWLEIPAARLRKGDSPYDWRAILENVEGWLAEHSLDKADFLQRELDMGTAEAAVGDQRRMTVLDAMLGALDKKQQHSVLIPLDIIETLLRKRV